MIRKGRFILLALAALAALALALTAAACGGSDNGGSGGTGSTGGSGSSGKSSVSGSLSFTAVWTGPEQKAFQAVLDGFQEQYPDVTVKFTSAGDQLPTVLSTAVQGGNPPDLAAIPQPGLIRDFQQKGAVKPLDFAKDTVQQNFGAAGVDVGSIDGTLYSLLFKASNKSTVWYNVQSYADAGVEAAQDWDAFLANAGTLKSSGVPAYSIGGSDGWTLTDLFENIYLRTAGPEKYDQLATHDIPWTDPSVKDALAEMAKVFGDSDNIAGGTQGALQTDFPTSVNQVFQDSPKAAQVIEGDFVAGTITTGAKAKTDYNFFAFPEIGSSGAVAEVGGDSVVMFKDSPAAQALVTYLASPEAAEIWAALGGFTTLNKNVDPSVYPDDITRAVAEQLAGAEAARFDMSDLAPSAFGATVGQGEWKLFQDFLKNPDDIGGITQQLEASAKKAYG